MRKNLTTKSIIFPIIFLIFITPLSIQALFAAEMPQYLANATEMFKSKTLSHTSAVYEDIVIDDLVMYEARSSNPCSLGSPQIQNSRDYLDVVLQNGTLWAADISKGNTQLNVQLFYDAQSDLLSFRKTLSSDLTYVVVQNNTSITFYQNRKPFVIIDNIQNCGTNACATIHFMSNRTNLSLYNCNTTLATSRAMAANSQNKPLALANDQHKMVIGLDAAEDVNTRNFKKPNHTVSTHQVAPNPTNSTTTISYVLTADAPVRVSIYNAIGQQIAVLVNENQTKGEQNIEWKSAELLRGGIYFYEIIANNKRMVGKIIKQ